MFEPKCDWWKKIKWEDRTVLLKGILAIKRDDYGRFVELALDAGMRNALAGDYDEESQSGEFWFDAEKEGPRGILNWLGFSVEDETEVIWHLEWQLVRSQDTSRVHTVIPPFT